MKVIEWDQNGCPTEESLERLEEVLADEDVIMAHKVFYAALEENFYRDSCGPRKVEVRGEIIDVWEYHTLGWSGNESIINTLQTSWMWNWLLERYDAGGHYYFKPQADLE
jgi:hypothetical protein